MNTVVSGALDRLHYEKDPCVKYDIGRKLWIYLHRLRSQEEFGKQESALEKHILTNYIITSDCIITSYIIHNWYNFENWKLYTANMYVCFAFYKAIYQIGVQVLVISASWAQISVRS